MDLKKFVPEVHFRANAKRKKVCPFGLRNVVENMQLMWFSILVEELHSLHYLSTNGTMENLSTYVRPGPTS